MAELADALDSGSSARKGVEVQVLSSALVNNGVSRHRGKPRFLWATRGTRIFIAVKKNARFPLCASEHLMNRLVASFLILGIAGCDVESLKETSGNSAPES